MAFDTEQMKILEQSMAALRALGCAVCVFTPEDVRTAVDCRDDEDQEADETANFDEAEWLLENRKMLEEGMSTWGNMAIADNLPDTAARD